MKNQIIESAIHLIEHESPLQFSVARVARKIGISQGNLTYYFPKKDDLIQVVVERLISRYTENFDFNKDRLDSEVISSNFLKFLLADAVNPTTINTFLFLWLNAQSNPETAKQLSRFYKTAIDRHLALSKLQGTCLEQRATFALLTVAGVVNGMIPIMGIAKSEFDYEAYFEYLRTLLKTLLVNQK